MSNETEKAQPKNQQVNVRVTKEERELIEDLAFVRGTSLDALVREHGVDEAVRLARQVRERFGSERTTDPELDPAA